MIQIDSGSPVLSDLTVSVLDGIKGGFAPALALALEQPTNPFISVIRTFSKGRGH